MKMVRVLVQIPRSLKAQLDALKGQGYTLSGFIRGLIERELRQGKSAAKGK